MMDLLDRVLVPGEELLGRVDQTLETAGVPPEHDLAALLRTVGLLPGEALDCVARFRQETFADLAIELRNQADGYAGRRAQVESEVSRTPWDGWAGSAFTSHWTALAEHLGDGEQPDEQSMAGRLLALRAYLNDVCDWISGARRDFALTVGEALGSIEAVRVRSAGDAAAAAAIGAKVLRTADAVLQDGFHRAVSWQYRLGELPFVASQPVRASSQPTRLEL
jgi:hypothetical protein